MKNLKRLIALVAVFALALTTVASAASFTDVAEDSAYYEAVETLTKLGIINGYEDGTYKPEQPVTRAEMAKLIAAMQGLTDSSNGSSVTNFSDVPASHWASGYIANATGVAINGYPDGTFLPEQTVKYEEAVKMIMATLGYTVIANGKGGYPMGYIAAATQEGVTKNVSNANIGTDANRGTIAQLIYNAIDTPLVEQITWEADGSGEYQKYDGTGNKTYKTLMSEYLDVVKMKGVVLANSYMDINNVVTIDKEADAEVEIAVTYGYKVAGNDFFDNDGDPINSSDTFLVGDTDAEAYVGMAVIFFAMENDYDEWEVISIAEDPTYNKSVTFSIADFDKDKTAADKFYYFKNNASTSTKLNVQTGANVLYNNAYFSGNVVTLITNLYEDNYSGQVTLLDTDKTAGYDLIVVEAAVSAVVDEINKGKIVLKDGVALPNGGTVSKIDTDNDNTIVVLTKDGKEITIDEVAEDDILSIVAISGGVYTVVDVMSNIVEGSVASKKNSTTSADGKAYKIDGTWYDVAAGADIGTVNSGDAGRFYIDKYGKIAYYDETVAGSTGNYAYAIATLLDNDSWGNNTMEVKLLNKEGVKTYKTADKFDIYKADGNKATYTVKDMDSDDGDDVEALLAGKVLDIKMTNNTIKGFTVAGYNEDNFDVAVATISNAEFSAEDFEIGRTSFEEDTLVFFVEEDASHVVKDSKSYVGTLADLEDKALVSGTAYVTNKADADADIVVLKNAVASTSSSSNIAVIVDIEDGSNADEEDIYTLTVLYKGEEVVLDTDADTYDDLVGEDLTIGDIVKIKVNGNNIITSLSMVYDFDEDVRAKNTAVDTDEVGNIGDADDMEYFIAGYPTAYTSASKKITIGGVSYKLSACDNVYVIDNTGRDLEVSVGAAADYSWDKFLEGKTSVTIDEDDSYTPEDVQDFVIIRMYDTDETEAVIIKGFDYDDAE